jgi:hypothetical protein
MYPIHNSVSVLEQSFKDTNPYATTAFHFSWVVTGGIVGLILSYYVERKIAKTGKYYDYDIACKVILAIGFVSCAILGILLQL